MTLVPDPAAVDYVRRVLDAYRHAPGTTGQVRPADRRLARELHARAVSVQTVDDALLLASVRRLVRATPASPAPTVRSFAYFLPIVAELLLQPLQDGHRRYLQGHLARSLARLAPGD